MIIVQAGFNDLENILELQKTAYSSEAELYKEIVIPPMKQSLLDIQNEYEDRIFYKLVMDSVIVGSVRVKHANDVCTINKLIVHPSFQGQGLGRALMDEAEKRAASCKRYELFTGHRSTKNLTFYKRLGYTEYKEQVVNDSLTLIHLYKEGE
jgi:ribosomal protein S18 acetylase RimI-like enzyme